MSGEAVVFCKGENAGSSENYTKVFQAAGYQCIFLKAIRFEFVNLEILREALNQSRDYFGLILTSRRSVEAIDLATKEDKSILNDWKSSKLYCVGPATESSVKELLKLGNTIGSESGNSDELAKLIVDQVKSSEAKPLLYPCSEIARETIQRTLTSENVKIDKIIVYKTLPDESLEGKIQELVTDSPPRIFIFFSPSVVRGTVSKLQKFPKVLEKLKIISIGPSTSEAIVNEGLTVHATASKPEPKALLEAVRQATS